MTDYFIDHDAYTAALTGTLTFTNGSTTVTGSGTAFTTELSTGDYIKSDDSTEGKEWYKVTDITSDTEFTIDHAFYQATHSSSAKKNSNDGLSVSNAFCHIQQFMDTAQAGDVGYVRRGKTYKVTMELQPVNDGTQNALITLMGDDGTGWADEAGLDKPYVEFADSEDSSTNAGVTLSSDNYWRVSDIRFRGDRGGGTYRVFRANIADYLKLDFCVMEGTYAGSTDSRPLRLEDVRICEVEGCEIKQVNGSHEYGTIYLSEGGIYTFKNCTFTNLYRVFNFTGAIGILKVYNPSIDGYSYTSPVFSSWIVYVRGDASWVGSIDQGSFVYIEDLNGTVGAHKTMVRGGTIEKDTSVYTGNADSSLKVTPGSNLGLYADYIEAFEWKITDVTAASHTVTVQVRGSGWTSFPNADELYIEVEYYDESTGTHTATAKSTDTLSANDTWTSFSVSFTPAQAGDIYVRGYLKKYEDGAVIYFNGEVEIT